MFDKGWRHESKVALVLGGVQHGVDHRSILRFVTAGTAWRGRRSRPSPAKIVSVDGTGDAVATGLTLDELAGLVGMSPRNVRAHQSRGLLPPPVLRGRVAYYDAHHVARLTLIRSLQSQGFSLESIRRILAHGQVYSAVVGEEVQQPWAEAPLAATDQLERTDPGSVARLIELGLLRRDGDRYLVALPVAGIAGHLLTQKVPLSLVLADVLEAAEAGHRLGQKLAADYHDLDDLTDGGRDALRIATRLLATVFEIAMHHGTEPSDLDDDLDLDR